MPTELPILNLNEAKFDCTFGRGCDGICCREGRPPVYAGEIETIAANLEKFLPQMRPEARAVVERHGFLVPRLRRHGERVPRVVDGWCIFFNRGCVLHQAGAEEGDAYRYKPSLCSLFPIQQDKEGNWFVRQKGYKGERWDLPCLDSSQCAVAARDSLPGEIALAMRFDEEEKAAAAAENRAS
jgi:Fe-S-cluster containining protein